jgi:glycosyltransferase involved in cell wall biosynthesis
MKIGIFVVMAGRRAGGPESYEVELIRAMTAMDRHNEYFVYCTGQYAVDAIGVKQENVVYRILRPAIRALSIPLALPILLAQDGVDFYHATFTPPPYSTKKLVFTMHCISSLVHPEFYRPATAWRLNHLLKVGMRSATRVICVSRTTLDHIRDSYGVSEARAVVVYNGVSRSFVPTAPADARQLVTDRLGIRDSYFLYVGKLQAHKNLNRLVRAFAQYRLESRSQVKLVLVGRKQGNSDGLDEAIEEVGLRSEVIQPGYVSADLLPVLYSGARAFLFPSLWEGFGIPLVEAMSCGTPVLTSNVTCLPEIAEGAAVIVDPYSVESIAEGICALDGSTQLRETLIAKGFARARQFSWENCARLTLDSYRQFG